MAWAKRSVGGSGKVCNVMELLLAWRIWWQLLLMVCCVGGVQAQTTRISIPPFSLPTPPGVTALPPTPPLPPAPPAPPTADANQLLQNEINALTANITAAVQKNYSFCITNGQKERDEDFGFNLNSSSPFVAKCFADTGGYLTQYLCGYGEIVLYFENLGNLDAPKPNMNCNASSWGVQCESGWAAAQFSNLDITSRQVPVRDQIPRACCDGFFCPQGLACMFPCPLGAYCPRATLNETTGQCDPYGYQPPRGQVGASQCGGADKWADVGSTPNIFCPAGQYCPTTVIANNCTKGNYCPLGSTTQYRCSKLTTCSREQLQKQSVTAIGGLIIAILTIILVLVYTCSDWLMEIRKKRKSRARDRAHKQAVERISGMERFRQAKEAAKRGAVHFSHKLSANLSRRRPAFDPSRVEELQTLNVSGVPSHISPSRISPSYISPSHISPRIISPMTEINEDGSTNGADIPVVTATTDVDGEVGDLYPSVPAPDVDLAAIDRKSKGSGRAPRRVSILNLMPQTQTQVFAYAYGEIEREKAAFGSSESRDVEEGEFYGAGQANTVGKMRPPIELTFVDLSLFLKGSGKKILSNVTGKLSPGRVTAVMGPSGAGKTTFLNALAGKATNSRTTGSVFINGKPDYIQAYKSIIGFVPQDDIVHGNLTVEENLWFSASYRLPVRMSKRDRVLVVERIIAALGLGPIRDSQVGTVEKRGISGGQRKRVNVGLEMVIEPSLLILDEPTSGLDSTSSRLVLQALRREASMGVNVGVVLHQPSYGLFKMFDDVMFLAKGGRTVYLGPVNEVESYFEGIGLVVPERVNPPDHYMDALEGIAVPLNQPDFDPSNLPVMWMLHKGYNIPSDMAAIASAIRSGTPRAKSMKEKKEPKRKTSFFQDIGTELWSLAVKQKDLFVNAFRTDVNKSGRKTPGFLRQYFIILRRLVKQRFREARVQIQDYVILLLAGVCLGPLSIMKDSNIGVTGYFYTLIALALLIMIASLRTFSNDKLTFWRESASGINRVAYFLAKDSVDLFSVVLKPVIYLSMFYFFSGPRSSFVSNYIVTLALVYCVTGLAYITSILLEPAPAQLMSVFIPILATLLVTVKHTGILYYIQNLSYARYANEAYAIANALNYKGVWVITRCGVLASTGYSMQNWKQCLIVLIVYGVVSRFIALICLFTSNRDKQK